jgi:glycerol-3-phosphate dehydrogenase
MDYEIAIIGSGLVGSAIAFDLMRLGIKIVVLESQSELGAGVSRSNSGILHTGFDSKPGTLETQLIRKQSERWPTIFEELGIPYKKVGAVLLAKNQSEITKLESIQRDALGNGVNTKILSKTKIQKLEPNVIAQAALHIPDEAMTDPYEVMRRLLYNVELKLNSPVISLTETLDSITVITPHERIKAKYAINCAGLFAGMFTDELGITPRRGEFIVFEKGSTPWVRHILLPMPNEFTKGVLVFPTLYGYLCAGPSAEDQEDKQDWTPHADALYTVHQKAAEMLPMLKNYQPVSAWAGLRTVGHPHNYNIEFSKKLPHLLHVAGIRSTGLSACLGISEYVIQLLKAKGLEQKSSPHFIKPTFTDTQPWWERLNSLRNIDVKQVLKEGKSRKDKVESGQ